MFMNNIGQPSILFEDKLYCRYKHFNGPLILSPSASTDFCILKNWCKLVIGSAEDMHKFQTEKSQKITDSGYKPLDYHVLSPFEPKSIRAPKIHILITLLPMGLSDSGQQLNAYIVKNELAVTLITDELSASLAFLPKWRNYLKNTIDIMYINDVRYSFVDDCRLLDPEDRERIYSLVHLIRPKCVYGLSEEPLPKWLMNLCSKQNYYALDESMFAE